MGLGDVNFRFGARIAELSRLWRAELDYRLRPIGLSQARWLVLVTLRDHPDGIRQSDLAVRIGIKDPTLVRQLDQLAAAGWIERREQPDDRRAKRVFITDKAAPLLAAITEVGIALRREMLQDLTEDEARICMGALDRIRTRLKSTGAARRNNEPERHVAAAE